MPRKGKKSAKPRTPTLIDGLTMEEMPREELEERIVRLQEDLDRKERNYFQLEREKIHTFWGITKRQLEEAKADLKNLDKGIEDDEEHHQVEIKVYKQKMKHFLCEHQNTISELKADGLTSTDAVQKELAQLDNELHKRMGDIRVDMQELDIENLVKELKLKHDEEMSKTSNSCKVQLTEIPAKFEKKVELWQQELDNMRKNVTSGKKEFWNRHISSLIRDHNNVFRNSNAISKSMEQDLDINLSLKDQIEGIKAKQKEKDLPFYLHDNKHFNDVLSNVKEETEVKEKMKYFIQKKDPNEKVKGKELAHRKRDYAVLEQKFSELQLERDELYKTFTQNIQKVQHNADLKITRLSKGLKAVTDSLEKTQAQLSSVLSASNTDQTALGGVTNKIEEDIDSSKDSIKNLRYIKAKISKACKELLLTHEAKQRALGGPVEELCVKCV